MKRQHRSTDIVENGLAGTNETWIKKIIIMA